MVTRQADWSAGGAEAAGSVEAALEMAASDGPAWIWVIGGGEIFAQTVVVADRLEVTELTHPTGFASEPGDVIAPAIDPSIFAETSADPPTGEHTSRSGIRYRFVRYERGASG